MTDDEMIGWHHRLNEFEQAPGDSEGQGSLACCSPWGHKKSDTTELLNSNNSQATCYVGDTLNSRTQRLNTRLSLIFPI